MSLKIESYDVFNKELILNTINEHLNSDRFFAFMPLVPAFYSSSFKHEFLPMIVKHLSEENKLHHMIIKQMQDRDKNDASFPNNKLFLSQKVSVIIFENKIAYLLRKDDVRRSIPEEESQNMVFVDAKEMLGL